MLGVQRDLVVDRGARVVRRNCYRLWVEGEGRLHVKRPLTAGKSTLAAELVDVLREQNLKCAVASMDGECNEGDREVEVGLGTLSARLSKCDCRTAGISPLSSLNTAPLHMSVRPQPLTADFYLPHAGLKALAAAHPTNAMLQGRGPPGTHDLPLLSDVLKSLRHRSPSSCSPLFLPTFDKSQHDGEGDRGPMVPLKERLDVFVLEGWSLGYGPLPRDTARERWEAGAVASQHEFDSLQTLNENLAEVEARIGKLFDCHVCITPVDFGYVYEWRLEQERRMKEKNGGRGMTDEQVRAFVDRYMPTYEVFGEVRPERETLTVLFNRDREIVEG